MLTLANDLQRSKTSIHAFGEIAHRVLHYLPDVLSNYFDKGNYRIYSSNIAGTTTSVTRWCPGFLWCIPNSSPTWRVSTIWIYHQMP